VVPSGAAAAAEESLRRWVDSTVAHEHFATLRLRPAEREQCVRMATQTAAGGHAVAPNYVHLACPVLYGTPNIGL
jgi:hypothetical protein